jgi:hypothetical protein
MIKSGNVAVVVVIVVVVVVVVVVVANNSVALVRERPPPSAKLAPTFADRGECRVVSAAEPHDHILGFLDRSRYFSIK